jgi:methylated-DNA-[protein]-cysteine S-methyltransferase
MITMAKLDDTPVGTIWVAGSEAGLAAVSLWDGEARFAEEVARLTGDAPDVAAPPGAVVAAALDQLAAYLRGERRDFDLPLDWSTMTPFQRSALARVCAVAYGRTSTYGTIAAELGQPGAVRAVGRANATNPIPIIIPCHRILGADGKLHGYGARGGLETKAWLLRLEGSWLL